MEPAALGVIRILCYDSVAALLRILPDHFVSRSFQANQSHMHRFRINISQTPRQLMAEILIEEKLHAAGIA